VQDAHDAGLLIHVWTLRKERELFETNDKILFESINDEIQAFFDAGVDGIFTDQPDLGVEAKSEFLKANSNANVNAPVATIVPILSAFAVVAFVISLLYTPKDIPVKPKYDDKVEEKKPTKKKELSNSH